MTEAVLRRLGEYGEHVELPLWLLLAGYAVVAVVGILLGRWIAAGDRPQP